MGSFLGSVARAVMNGAAGALTLPAATSGDVAQAVGGLILMGISIGWSWLTRKGR